MLNWKLFYLCNYDIHRWTRVITEHTANRHHVLIPKKYKIECSICGNILEVGNCKEYKSESFLERAARIFNQGEAVAD